MPPTGNGSSIRDRAAAGPDPQESMLDHQWDDEQLLAALEEREQLKAQRLEAQKAFKVADDAVKHELGRFQLAVGEVARIGRFRIKRKSIAERSVEFTTGASDRLEIKLED